MAEDESLDSFTQERVPSRRMRVSVGSTVSGMDESGDGENMGEGSTMDIEED